MICDRIKAAREKTGMSARKFAETIGLKYTTYYGYETGAREPGADTLALLVKHLNVSSDYILGIESNKEISPPSSEDEEGELTVDEVISAFVSAGLVSKNQDLTDEDLRFFISIIDAIDSWFSQRNNSI